MGGNARGTNAAGQDVLAQRVDLREFGRGEFVKKFNALFKKINALYKAKYGELIWIKESNLDTAKLYNGSTSYIMDTSIPDEELIKYKPSAGDLDIITPAHTKENLWYLLQELEGQEIVPGVTYHGNNKPNVNGIAHQINCVFIAEINDQKFFPQVDFEFVEMKGEDPSIWNRFAHGSSFEDQKKGIKAVAHKYLLMSIASGLSVRDDIIVATPASTPDKIRKKKIPKGSMVTALKFSVDRGMRNALEPMKDERGNPVELEGKPVYKEVKTSDSTYETSLENMFYILFGDAADFKKEGHKMWSFVGLVDLINKYAAKKHIPLIIQVFAERLWGARSQKLDRDSWEVDFDVKNSAYEYLKDNLRAFKEPPGIKDTVEVFYAQYDKKKLDS